MEPFEGVESRGPLCEESSSRIPRAERATSARDLVRAYFWELAASGRNSVARVTRAYSFVVSVDRASFEPPPLAADACAEPLFISSRERNRLLARWRDRESASDRVTARERVNARERVSE